MMLKKECVYVGSSVGFVLVVPIRKYKINIKIKEKKNAFQS